MTLPQMTPDDADPVDPDDFDEDEEPVEYRAITRSREGAEKFVASLTELGATATMEQAADWEKQVPAFDDEW